MTIDMQPIDYLHGKLKDMMYETEQKLEDALLGEGYEYLEGYMDALVKIYGLTYNVSFKYIDGEFDRLAEDTDETV